MRSTSLRVLFVFADGTPTEANRAAVTVVGVLPRANVEPVACFLDEGPLATVCRDDLGIETIEMAASARNGHAAERGVRRVIEMALRTAHPDLVHSIGAVAHSSAGRAAGRAGVPGVWTQWDTATVRSGRQLWARQCPAARCWYRRDRDQVRCGERADERGVPHRDESPPDV